MADLELWQLVWGSLRTLLKSGHQLLARIKRAHHLEVEAEKVQEDLRAEISHLQEKIEMDTKATAMLAKDLYA
ncbi:hypothetical protein COCNU_scaffold004134G000010 [Cocos nucifera]|nr:hypothetical protein [Cocos nucifera]